MRTLRPISLLLPAILLAWPGDAAAEPRVALVVGNSEYGALPDLETAAEDARRLAAELEGLGFETVLGVDLASNELELAVQELRREAAAAEQAVVAFFGHSLQAAGAGYLLPTDFGTESTPDIDIEAVTLADLARAASRADTGAVLVDAAYGTGLDLPGAEPGLAPPTPLPANVVMFLSAEPGRLIVAAPEPPGAFAGALLDALAEQGMPASAFVARVRDAVTEATGGAQRPSAYGPVEDLDLVFYPTSAGAQADGTPEVVQPLPEDRAPAGLPARPQGNSEPRIVGVPEVAPPVERGDGVPTPPEGEEPLIQQAAEEAPEAGEAALGAEPEPVEELPEAPMLGADPDVDIELDPPERADTRLGEPLAEPENPDALPAEPLPIPTEPGGAAADVDVGEMDPETPRRVTATPDPDDIAPSPAEARQEVATPDDGPIAAARPDAGEDAGAPASARQDPPLTAAERRTVQRSLSLLGYYDYRVDGIFGPVTREAVRAFQREIGAEPTGHLSPAQIDRLYAMAEAER